MGNDDDQRQIGNWLAERACRVASGGDSPAAESDVTMHAVGISRSPRFVGTSVFVEDNLLPLMVGAMIGAVVGLGYRAGQRRGYGPLAVGILSASMLLLGRFVVVSDVMMYLGGGMLIIASVWNSWPRERATTTVVELEFPCNLDSHSTEN